MAYILYHSPCFDGFGAAWAALQGLSGKGHLEFVPVQYGQKVPTLVTWEGSEHEPMYLVDFSYSRAVLDELTKGRDLYIIDHHKTAQDDLKDYPNTVFDMNHSGAVLTWQYFFPGRAIPDLLLYVEDRDLWKFQMPNSKEINAWIASYPKDFQTWDFLERELQERGLLEGRAILRFTEQKVKEITDQSFLQPWEGYGKIPVVNTSCFMSEVAQELLARHPESPFVAYRFERADGCEQWGLRSRKDFDCSEVAKKLGGGGHPQAAGFVI